MTKKAPKSRKSRDRFEEIRDEILRGTGMMVEEARYDIKLVAEQVAGNSEQISEIKEELSKLSGIADMMRYELKLKTDSVELMTLSRRVTMLEKKLAHRK